MVGKRVTSKRSCNFGSYPLLREFLAEFTGTLILVLCINGSTAQSMLTGGRLAGFLAGNFAGGVGVMAGVWIAGGITGGHLNPAMSFGLACAGKLSWRKLPIYWLAQYLGAFAAASCVFGVYMEAIYNKTGGELVMTDQDPGLAAIFSTYPSPYLSVFGSILDQTVEASLLLISASAINDSRNCNVPLYWVAFYMGMLVTGLGVGFSANCGSPLNPARDLSPRLFSYLVGWGTPVFSYNDWMWFWVPVVFPHLGAAIGAIIYLVFIEAHWSP